MTTRGRANEVRKTGKARPVAVGGICTPSAAARVGATSCCTAGIEYAPVLTAGPANMSGIETSYAHGEPCMYTTSGSGRVMKSPSRGTMRSWPVRPGKYARANMSRNRCRAARAAAIGRRHTSGSRPAAPRRSLDLLAGNRPSHRNQGQGEEDGTASGQPRGDDKGSPRRHGTRLEEEVSDPPSALAGTIDACHWRPNGWRVSGERRAEGDERVRCTRVLGGTLITAAQPVRSSDWQPSATALVALSIPG